MSRTLFIGLDGATFTTLDEMTRDIEGVGVTMPFMRRFLEGGVRAPLQSTPNPLTPPAWASIMTGRTPGNHGIFDFIRSEDKGDEVYFTLYDARDIAAETVWSIASRAGRSVVALNFPMTAPPRRINGSLVPGFVPWKHLRRNVYPAELFDRLKTLPDFSPRELAWDFDREKQALEAMGEEETENWIRYHLPREDQWFRIAEFLYREDQPDLMAVLFDGVDKIQHQAWQFVAPELVRAGQTPWEQRMRRLVLDYFRKLDGYLERLVGLAGPEATVVMASDHGFTTTTEVVRINTFLHQRGYLQWKDDGGDSELTRRRNASNFANVDWAQTTAYCRTPSSNGIAIRVAREAGKPGIAPQDYESFRARLIADLESLVDETTGERIVKEIKLREDCFAGSQMATAPDLTLVLRDHGFVSIRNIEPVVEPRPAPAGTHHPHGVFVAAGPGVRAGGRLDLRRLEDVAPLLLHSLGLEVPEDMEGEVPDGLYTAEALARAPVRIGAPTLPVRDGEAQQQDIEEGEKEKILEQLKMLGYME